MLVQKGYKVARVEQTETPQMMEERVKKSKNSTSPWSSLTTWGYDSDHWIYWVLIIMICIWNECTCVRTTPMWCLSATASSNGVVRTHCNTFVQDIISTEPYVMYVCSSSCYHPLLYFCKLSVITYSKYSLICRNCFVWNFGGLYWSSSGCLLPFVTQFEHCTSSRNGLGVFLTVSSDSSLCSQKSTSSAPLSLCCYIALL